MVDLVSRFVFRPYWRLTRAMTLGVRGFVTDDDDRILLVRHSYTPGWHMPGGGVERGETLEVALGRELQEEGGIEPQASPRLHGVFANAGFRGDHVAVFIVETWREVPSEHGREIVETGFFSLRELPDGTSEGTRQRINEIRFGAPLSAWWAEEA